MEFIFAAGIVLGGFIAVRFIPDPNAVQVAPALLSELKQYNIIDNRHLLPSEIFSWQAAVFKRFFFAGSRRFSCRIWNAHAGGCTSGHAIMGLSNLQWPSLVATICFMIGGFVMANLILPFILSL